MSQKYEWPIGVRTVNLSLPLGPLTGLRRYSRVRVFVSRGQDLVGSVDIWNRGADSISTTRLLDEITARLALELFRLDLRTTLTGGLRPPDSLTRSLAGAPDSPLRSRGSFAALPRSEIDSQTLRTRLREATRPGGVAPAHVVSIIVPTCGRVDDLRRCLSSLVAQRTRHTVDVLVVDNRPSAGTAATAVQEFPTVRLIAESRPGLSYARNTGILHAHGSIIVTTDDDVVAPPDWIEKLVAPFAREEVMAVTGHVLPLELETEAQCRFEAYGGLGKGFAPSEVNGDWFHGRRSAVPTWTLGATANAAFRRSIFTRPEIGMLDEALGAGTPTGCSEDTYLFYRILKAGHTIVYEPSAYVWHRHRQTMKELRSQIYAYSKGHVAYQLTTWMRDGDRRALMRLLYGLPRTYAERTWHRLRRWSDYPLSLIALEILGNLAGPLALWRSRARVRRLGRSERPVAERTDVVSLEGQTT